MNDEEDGYYSNKTDSNESDAGEALTSLNDEGVGDIYKTDSNEIDAGERAGAFGPSGTAPPPPLCNRVADCFLLVPQGTHCRLESIDKDCKWTRDWSQFPKNREGLRGVREDRPKSSEEAAGPKPPMEAEA